MKIAGTRFPALPDPESLHILPGCFLRYDLIDLCHSRASLQPLGQLIYRRFFTTSEHFDISIVEVDCMAAQAQRIRHFASAVAKPYTLNTAFDRESARTWH